MDENEKNARLIIERLLEQLSILGCSAESIFTLHLCIEEAILTARRNQPPESGNPSSPENPV
jgi:hypothetical protein